MIFLRHTGRQAHLFSIAQFFFGLLITTLFLNSCASPEATLREREKGLREFAGQVVMHILDRNPETYRGSVSRLMREELDDQAIATLQSEGILPEPGLDELRVVAEAQEAKTSNKVSIEKISVLGPVKADVVPFEVVTKVTDLIGGKPSHTEKFPIKIVCKLTEDMSGYPRAVKVSGLPNLKHVSNVVDQPRNKGHH